MPSSRLREGPSKPARPSGFGLLALAVRARRVGYDWPVNGLPHDNVDVGVIPDADDFRANGERLGSGRRDVRSGVARHEPFDIEILDVGVQIGKSPSHPVVPPQDDAGNSRKRRADRPKSPGSQDEPGTRPKAHRDPDEGHLRAAVCRLLSACPQAPSCLNRLIPSGAISRW